NATYDNPLTDVTAGETVPIGYRFDYWLPAGIAPTLYVSGRECDIPLIDCTQERYGAPPRDTFNPFSEAGYNDKPGRIEFGNSGLIMFPGTATYQPAVSPNLDTTSEDLSDAACSPPGQNPPSTP